LDCQKGREHVRKEIQDYMEQKKNAKDIHNMLDRHIHQCTVGEEYGDDDDDDDDDCVKMYSKGGKVSSGGSKGSSSIPFKKPKQKGSLDMFFTPNSTNVVKGRKEQGR